MKTGITINSKASTCLEPFDARLIESLAFTVNSHGDRTPEGHFDNERTMTYETVYTRLNTKRAAEGAKTGRTTFPDVVMQGGSVRFSGPVSWRLALCLLDGRRLHAQQLQHQLSASLPSALSPGSYITVVSSKLNHSFSITISN